MRVPVPTSLSVKPSNTPLRESRPQGATAETFGAGVGRSLLGVSQQTMGLANYVRQQEDQKIRFAALRGLSEFQKSQRLALEEAKRNVIPGDSTFYEASGNNFRMAEKAFLEGIADPELREEFSVRTAELGAGLGLDAMEYQRRTNDDFFKQNLQLELDNARVEIGQDGSKESLERQRAHLDELLMSSGLSEPEKVAIQRKMYQAIEGVAYRSAQAKRLRDEKAGTGGTDVQQAAQMLVDFSGVAPDEAEAQAQQGLNIAVQAVGSLDMWAELPTRVRTALVSVAASEGELSEPIMAALASGDLDKLAEAIRENGNEVEGDLINNPEANIDNDESFSNLPYEDRLTLLADAQREIAAETAAEQAAAKAQQQSLVNALHVALYEGTAGQTDIDAMKERGILTDYDDMKKADEILAKRDEEVNLKLIGQQMMAGAITYAPGNEDHKKVLNAMIGKEGIAAIDKKDSQFAANTLIPIVRQTGAVPSDVVDLLRGMIRSPDGDRAYWALDLMSQIQRANDKAYDSFPADDQKDLDFWQARRDYMTQEEMVKALRGPMDPAERNARIALREQGRKLFTDENGPLRTFDAASLFRGNNLFGNINQPAPRWVDAQLETDFQTLFLDNYERYGNVDEAKKAAETQLKRVWGPTNIGADDTLMKYPPEKFYPTVQGSHNWLEEQIRREGLIADDEQFGLVTDTQTENEWQTQTPPSYILTKKKDGRTEIMFDDQGLPMRVFFDFGAQEQADEQMWRDAQRTSQEIIDYENLFNQAVKHSWDTGTPIPGELLPDGSGGIADFMMNPTEEEQTAREQDVRNMVFGDPNNRVSIDMDKYGN
jgi:hypothetical protein